jgi:hypothetical protein
MGTLFWLLPESSATESMANTERPKPPPDQHEPNVFNHARFRASESGRRLASETIRGCEPKLLKTAAQVSGAPGEVRTHDLQLRRLSLYPSELRAHGCVTQGGGQNAFRAKTAACLIILTLARIPRHSGFRRPCNSRRSRRSSSLTLGARLDLAGKLFNFFCFFYHR